MELQDGRTADVVGHHQTRGTHSKDTFITFNLSSPKECFNGPSPLLFHLLGLAARGEERGVPVGERTLRTAGRNGKQPRDSHSGTFSVTDTAGSSFFTQDTDIALHFYCSLNLFLPLWVFF